MAPVVPEVVDIEKRPARVLRASSASSSVTVDSSITPSGKSQSGSNGP
ncbi:hypothetical protein [Polaromonas sp.]|nr:hypothetical protein [Polaromonas sp.]